MSHRPTSRLPKANRGKRSLSSDYARMSTTPMRPRQDLVHLPSSSSACLPTASRFGRMQNTNRSSARSSSSSSRHTVGSARTPTRTPRKINQYDDKTNLSRIRSYVLEHAPQLADTLKPPTTNTFVNVIQLLLLPLYGPTKYAVTMKNYKVEVPIRMKEMEYQPTISQSFLKSPNIPMNFPHVLAIWTHLYDMVEMVTKPWDGVKGVDLAWMQFLHNVNDENREEALAEYEARIYEAFRCSREELDTQIPRLEQEVQQYREENEHWKGKLEKLEPIHDKGVQELALLEEKNQNNQLATINKNITQLQTEVDFKTECLVLVQSQAEESAERLSNKRGINAQIGITLHEFQQLEKQLEDEKRYLAQMQERMQLYEQDNLKRRKQGEQLMVKAQKLVFDYNTQLTLSKLPHAIKCTLRLDETENTDKARVLKILEEKKIFQRAEDDLKQSNIALHSLKSELDEQDLKREGLTESIKAKYKEQARLDAKYVELDKEMDEFDKKIEQIRGRRDLNADYHTKAVNKYNIVSGVYNKRKATTEEILGKMEKRYLEVKNNVEESRAELVQYWQTEEEELRRKIAKAIKRIPTVEKHQTTYNNSF